MQVTNSDQVLGKRTLKSTIFIINTHISLCSCPDSLAHMVHVLTGCGEDISGILEQRIGEFDASVESLCSAIQPAANLTSDQA